MDRTDSAGGSSLEEDPDELLDVRHSIEDRYDDGDVVMTDASDVDITDDDDIDDDVDDDIDDDLERDTDDELESDIDDKSSTLSELSHSPTPPPEIHIPVAPTGPRVRFHPVTETVTEVDSSDSHHRDILRRLIGHPNIVDFYHVDADDPTAAEDGPEDPDCLIPPAYIPRFTDIRTLKEIIRQHRKPPGIPTSIHPAGLPQGLVWHVMISILRALTYLHTGQHAHPRKPDAPPGWMPIVHNSVRPENIILAHPMAKTSKHPAFRHGRCMLGNFENCLVLPSGDDIRSQNFEDLTEEDQEDIAECKGAFATMFYGGEKFGYEAPETMVEDGEGTHFPGPWSDLWSLGALGVEMMTGRNVWDLILEIGFEDYADAMYDEGKIEERWRSVPVEHRHMLLLRSAGTSRIVKGLPSLYSYDLRILVEALLAPDPWDRGAAVDVLEDAERRYEAWLAEDGYRIWEREAMDDMIEDLFDRQDARIIKEAEERLAWFEEKERKQREQEEREKWDREAREQLEREQLEREQREQWEREERESG